ncbi:membrane transport protein XK isoform X1 [Gadus macrocephalus]|uniref:membrane transport protein XK isoform X1 n=1 Tax=Gadus macrocephalus TaxID=80720 RepID=UPI0028CB7E83|nr:membrane transport protein XK isoform X1 [Gadus macrocephalus]
MRFPSSIFVSVSLFTAETTAALYLSSTYRSAGDQIWQGLTLLFTLLASVLVQLTLTFIHRDLNRDRPLVLFLHLLQLGPIVRCLEAFCIYGSVGVVEEPYVSITKKKQIPRGGPAEEVERHVGQAEGKLFTHRAAFARTSVIQAFLGSAPQLTLQLYICVLQRGMSVGRGTLMVISLLSIVYGALRCNILAIKIKYEEYEVDISPMAYFSVFMWRGFEIATRVVVLVLFSSVLKLWVLPVVSLNFLAFFFYPWVLFWLSHSPFPENIEKTLSRLGTTVVLCLLTFLYAGINMFCWSAVQLKLSDPDLINKSHNWYRMAVFYTLRFLENALLLSLWYLHKTDFYTYVCAPLLLLQLLVAYAIGIFFMLVFYRFCHPCRRLFSSSMTQGLWDCSMLLCLSCRARSPENRLVESPEKGLKSPDASRGTSDHSGYGTPNDTTFDLLDDSTYDVPNELAPGVGAETYGAIGYTVAIATHQGSQKP